MKYLAYSIEATYIQQGYIISRNYTKLCSSPTMLQGHLLCTTFSPINCSCAEILAVKSNFRQDFFFMRSLPAPNALWFCNTHVMPQHIWQLWNDPEHQEWTCGNEEQSAWQIILDLSKITNTLHRGFKKMQQNSYRLNVGKELKIIKSKRQPSTATVIPESLKHITQHQAQMFLKHFQG